MLLFWSKVGQADVVKADELMGAARAAFALGDLEKTLSLATTAISLYETVHLNTKLADARVMVAQTLAALGQVDPAAEEYERALALIGSSPQSASLALALGELYLGARRHDEALAALTRARDVSAKFSLADVQLQVVCRIAYLHYDREAWAASERAYREALRLAEAQANTEALDSILLELGNCVAQQGRFEAARALFERGAQAARATGDPKALSAALHGMAVTYVATEELDEAARLFNESLRLKLRTNDRVGVAHTLYELGVMEAEMGRCESALDLLEQSVMVFEAAGAHEVEVARAGYETYAVAC